MVYAITVGVLGIMTGTAFLLARTLGKKPDKKPKEDKSENTEKVFI